MTPPPLKATTGGGDVAPAGATAPTTAPAAADTWSAVISALTQVTQALSVLTAALGQQQLGSIPGGGAAATSGFVTNGDAAEVAQLNTGLQQIQSTTVGAQLLNQIRNKNVSIDIVDDAEFQQRTGAAPDAQAVFLPGATPTVLVLRSKLDPNNPTDLAATLSHELVHAAQHVNGETAASYGRGIGAAASGLNAQQLAVGGTLMMESGAELIASSIAAQMQDPVQFAAVARTKIDAASAANWSAVNAGGYNPQGFQLPQFVSPVALQIVKGGLGIA